MTDSPAGLAAWIVEKFRAWSDCGGDVESVFTRDQMLADISFYWFTGAIGSSFYPYYFRMHRPWMIPEGGAVTAPTAYAEFPREILRPPRSLAEPHVHRHSPLDGHAEGRTFRRDGAARRARGRRARLLSLAAGLVEIAFGPQGDRHCERSEAIQGERPAAPGSPRRFARRDDNSV